MLHPESLLESAREQFETDDFGPPIYLPALRVLCEAINEEAGLEEQREWLVGHQWTLSLGVRAQVAALLRKHPEIHEVPVRAPIFISGLLRTGTTMLHNTLSLHPSHDAPRFWEMRSVVRPEGAGAEWEENKREEAQAALELLNALIPELYAIHPMRADWPDECSQLFRHSFASLNFVYTNHIPKYRDWLTGIDMVPYYEYYKKLLQIIYWKKPEKRLVLKDPSHLWHLDALLQVFPDAHIILLHRNLEEVLPSMASLCFALHRLQSNRTDPTALAGYCLPFAAQGLEAMMKIRGQLSHPFLDVSYQKLIVNPMETVREICDRVGTTTSEQDIERMRTWLLENKQHKAGKHIYTLEQFGFNKDEIVSRFQEYNKTYL